MKPLSPQEVAQVCGGLDVVSFLPPENALSPFGPSDQTNPVGDPPPDPYPEYP